MRIKGLSSLNSQHGSGSVRLDDETASMGSCMRMWLSGEAHATRADAPAGVGLGSPGQFAGGKADDDQHGEEFLAHGALVLCPGACMGEVAPRIGHGPHRVKPVPPPLPAAVHAA